MQPCRSFEPFRLVCFGLFPPLLPCSNTNGSFRLGAKNPSTRHVMGAVDASQMVAVPTADYDDSAGAGVSGGTAYANGNGNHYDVEEDAGGSR